VRQTAAAVRPSSSVPPASSWASRACFSDRRNVLKEVEPLTSYYIRKQKMKRQSKRCLPGLWKVTLTLTHAGYRYTCKLRPHCPLACIGRNFYPSSLNYYNFPKSCCTSVNEVTCHGILDRWPLQEGDIVNVDITLYCNGYPGDLNETFFCWRCG
jgi:hypothetical protein